MATKPESKPEVKYDLVIGIRRFRSGSFAGLYEVVELDKNMSVVRVVTDANSKSMACALAANAIARCL